MKYKFYPIESKIIDLLIFPKCIYLKNHENEEEEQNLLELIGDAIHEEFKEVESALKPYEKNIKKFYYGELSIVDFIVKRISPFGFESAQTYFNYLQALDESELLKSILTKLYLQAYDVDVVDDERIDALAEQKEEQMNLIESLGVQDEEKWKVSSLVRQPKQTINEWITLIIDIEPIFEEYYQWKKDKILNFGYHLEKKLNDDEVDAFVELTDGLVDKNLVPTGNLLVSFVEPVNIEINVSSSTPYLKMGVEIVAFLQLKKEAEEAQLKERVGVFKNLGDKTRYEVIKLIAQGVESSKEIAQVLNVSQPTISYHMNHLIMSKVIKFERVGTKFVHVVNFAHLEYTYNQMLKDFGK